MPTRRDFLKTAAALGAATMVPFNIRIPSASAQSPGPIVVVIVDDLMNFKAMDRYIPSWPRRSSFDPWMRGFARQNSWFMNAHTASTSCGSSRPAMLWGIPAAESGILSQSDADWWNFPAYSGRRSIVGQLRDAGWNTYGFGKVFHHQHEEDHDPGCWTEYTKHQWFKDMRDQAGGDYSAYQSASLDPFGRASYDVDLMPDHSMITSAIRRVETLGDGDAIFVGIHKPHVPLQVPARFFDAIDPSEIVLPQIAHDVATTGDAAAFVRNAFAADMQGVIDTGEWRDLIHAYLAAVKYADYEFGRLIRAVYQYVPNARVIVTSDHGFALGERGAFSKQTNWDQSTAMPLIVSGPRQRVHTAVSSLDIMPTIQEWAGLPQAQESLLGVASRGRDETRAVVTSYRVGDRRASAVRRGGHQLIDYQDGSSEFYWVPGDPWELTDMTDRPWEAANIAACRAHMPAYYAS